MIRRGQDGGRWRTWRYRRDLLRELVSRDLKLRYKRSVLGMAWSLLNPLAQLLVFGFVFTRVLPVGRSDYLAFLFCGLLCWTWFQSSLVGGTVAITENRDLVRRPGFPVAVLPVARVASDLIHFLLALPLLLALTAAQDGGHSALAMASLPLVVGVQFLLTLGLVYVVATFHVTFRDTQYLIGVSLMLFFYLTPVLYDVSHVPAAYQAVYRLNPVLHLAGAYRAILLEGRLPDFGALAAVAAVSLALLHLGYRLFVRASWTFAEEL